MQAAEKLKITLWGKGLDIILEELSIEGSTWKYVPKEQIHSLEIQKLGYDEGDGLLVRKEYEAAYKMDMFKSENALKLGCGGIVVTGQPGIGVFLPC
jgi:hypothetical protein